jgi:stage V sporulation protein D (sporulation-specific penicillin-binding protein)
MPSPTNLALKRRLEGSFVLLMVLFFALAARLVWIQGMRQRHFSQLAESIHRRKLVLPPERGVITDRRMREIASTIESKTLFANPQVVPNKAEAAQRIAAIMGGDPQYYLNRLNREKTSTGRLVTFTYLKRKADRNKVDRVLALKIPGIEAQAEPKRIYPSGPLAAHILGFVGIDGDGKDGIEGQWEKILRGRDGKLLTEVDAIGRPIPDTDAYYEPPVNGGTVQLTIDATIQEFAEAELRKIEEQFAPESACAIVVDIPTGEVLALANTPTFDPNQPGATPAGNRKNRAIQDWYEPGSTFKTLAIAEALERGMDGITANCGHSRAIGNHVISCAHGASHGRVGLLDIERESCNLGAAAVGLKLGAKDLYAAIKRFGFFNKTGIELPSESWGNVGGWAPEDWPNIKTANVAFGQGVVVTPIEMLQMYAAIANDGVLVPPSILLSVNGKPQQRQKPPRRVMRADAARKLCGFMEAVVAAKGGTGHNAKIPNFRVGGKTGTAQLVRNGRYVHGAYVGSFIGFLPVSRPRIAILAAVTWPTKGGTYGGTVAAPAFREIARQTMAYLHIPPDAPGDYRDGGDRIRTFARWEHEYGDRMVAPPPGSTAKITRAAAD